MTTVTIDERGHAFFPEPDSGEIWDHGLAQDAAVNWPDVADEIRVEYFKWVETKLVDRLKADFNRFVAQHRKP